ncbi:MAG: antitoxin Xre/MbcA/ParS toxin-binding domain-containing protein [Acidobacteriaceae bacterium]
MSIAEIAEVLGGKGTFHHAVDDYEDLAASIRGGLPSKVITVLSEQLALHRTDVASRLGIPQRTLTRRLSRHSKLTAAESDRAARMARIIALATEVLGDRDKSSSWLRTPNRALHGNVPLDEIETDPGYRSVEEILYSIGYGMYS